MGLSAYDKVRKLLTDMLAVVDSSPDALQTRYGELRDESYSLAVQVRTAALPCAYSPKIDWAGDRMIVT